MDTQTIQDGKGKEISVGSRIRVLPGVFTATVYEITDVDADYDDELQRAVMYEPKVKFRYEDGTEDEASTVHMMSWPDEMYFMCEDVEVVA